MLKSNLNRIIQDGLRCPKTPVVICKKQVFLLFKIVLIKYNFVLINPLMCLILSRELDVLPHTENVNVPESVQIWYCRFCIILRAKRSHDGIIFYSFFSDLAEDNSNSTFQLHSKMQSFETTEVDIFRVIYRSPGIISIRTSCTFTARVKHLFFGGTFLPFSNAWQRRIF